MKFVCSGIDLSDGVNKVFKAAPSKSLTPIMEGILLEAKGGFLELTATDGELTIQKKVVAQVLIEGSTVVPGKLFCEFIKKLTADQIEIGVDANNRMHISYQDNKGQLACMPSSEFPEIHQLQGAQKFVIVKSEFRDLISKVEFCCSLDDSRPILKGVLLEIEDHNITAVALDGYRLAKVVKPLESTTARMNAVVPKRSINEIIRLLEDNTEALSVLIQKNYILVDLEHTRITSRLLDGDYINYRQILPKEFSSTMVVSKEALEDSLDRASLLVKIEKTNLVKFDINDKTLEISSNSEIGNITEKLNIKLDGVELKIAFNSSYFTQLLKTIDTQNITIKFISAINPAVVLPTDSADDVMFLVLPVRMA